MRDDVSMQNKHEYNLHLTVQSGELIRSGMKTEPQISIACDISAMPGVNCTLVFSPFEQNLGPIGVISFDRDRPTAHGRIKVSSKIFGELIELLKISPPRPASIFLITSRFENNIYGDISVENTEKSLTIFDIKWRYPIL